MPAARACIHCRSPNIKTAILCTIFSRIIIAETGISFKVQVFRHPHLIADFYGSISLAIAGVCKCSFGRLRTAAGFFAAVAAQDDGIAEDFDVLFECGHHVGIAPTLDILAD